MHKKYAKIRGKPEQIHIIWCRVAQVCAYCFPFLSIILWPFRFLFRLCVGDPNPRWGTTGTKHYVINNDHIHCFHSFFQYILCNIFCFWGGFLCVDPYIHILFVLCIIYLFSGTVHINQHHCKCANASQETHFQLLSLGQIATFLFLLKK